MATHLEQVERNLKGDLANLEAKLAGKISKKERKSLEKQAGKIRWRLKHRWFEGDPPGYVEAMQGLPTCNVAAAYNKGLSAKEYAKKV